MGSNASPCSCSARTPSTTSSGAAPCRTERCGSKTGEAQRSLEHNPPLVVPALEATLKTSHLFNLLDARGSISVTERVGLIARVRRNAVAAAHAYVEQRAGLGFPLGGRELG